MAEAGWKSKVNHATTLNGSYTAIAGMKSVTFPLTRQEIDTSSLADDTGWRTFIYGMGGVEITFSGDEVEGNTEQEALRDALTGGTTVFLSFLDDSGDGYKGEFLVLSVEKSASMDGAAQVSFRCKMTGAPTEV